MQSHYLKGEAANIIHVHMYDNNNINISVYRCIKSLWEETQGTVILVVLGRSLGAWGLWVGGVFSIMWLYYLLKHFEWKIYYPASSLRINICSFLLCFVTGDCIEIEIGLKMSYITLRSCFLSRNWLWIKFTTWGRLWTEET